MNKARQYQIPRPQPPIGGGTPPPPQSDLYPISQPDQARYALQHWMRYEVGPTPILETLLQPQSYLFAVGQGLSYQTTQIPGVTKQLDALQAPSTVAQSYLFANGQPQFRIRVRIPLPKPPIVEVPAKPTFEFPVNQPELAWQRLAQRLRYQVDVVPREDLAASATAPQLYEFKPHQPDGEWFARLQRARYQIEQSPGQTVFSSPFTPAWAFSTTELVGPIEPQPKRK